MRASAWQDPCSLLLRLPYGRERIGAAGRVGGKLGDDRRGPFHELGRRLAGGEGGLVADRRRCDLKRALVARLGDSRMDHFMRSEEHTSELQSLMRISYAVFCLKKKNN